MGFIKLEYTIKGNLYYVYIIKNNDIWEYWLQDKDYGVMLSIYDINEYDIETLENNLENYVDIYKDYIKE